MSVTATAHLNFDGRAREALEFYGSVFGGHIVVATYADFGMPGEAPGADRVVWGQVAAESGFRVMAYDVPAHATPGPVPARSTRRELGTTVTTEPFFLSVRGETVEELRSVWAGLAEGATVVEEFGPAPWAPAFGMLTDRFGVTWVLDVAG